MSGIISDPENGTFYVQEFSAAISTGKGTSMKDVVKPTTTVVKAEGTEVFSPWGEDNDFPQKVIADVQAVPAIGPLLDTQARLLYSGGLAWGRIEYGADGQEKMVPLEDSKNKVIKEFMRRTNIGLYLIEAATDLYWFKNVFPELILSKDRSEILQICTQAAEECRWEKQDKSTGLVKNCYISANWPDAKVSDKETKKLPVLDPYYDPATALSERKDGTNYIYPLSYPSPGNKYYQLASWNALRSSGWLDVIKSIPKFKKALLENQLTIKYHIEISDQYWGWKFKDFQKKTESEQKKLITGEIQAFVDAMKGADKTGKPFFSAFKSDPHTGKDYSGWKVHVIDDKIKDGQYLEDGKEASAQIMNAIGVHPALTGMTPDSGLGGAGSNIREAYNLHILTNRPHQDLILAPLYLIKQYNGWDEEVEFRFRNSFMNTLDKGSETTQATKQADKKTEEKK